VDAGPRFQDQMRRLGMSWRQGEHVLTTGSTGSGKTLLARHIIQQRINRGGHVVVMVAKPKEDATIVNGYKGFTRWASWKKRPRAYENKILLWPKVEKLKGLELLAHQKSVFRTAFDELSSIGLWTLVIDEGLYTTSTQFLNMSQDVAMLHAMGRSGKLTILTNAQRPSHLPLIVYSSAAHVFAGRIRETVDMKRLAELGGKFSSRELGSTISGLGRHDFLWIPVATDGDPEVVNYRA
jgi:energy-coupling factor transporter ATP-binding protein EcfA2